MTGTVIAIFVSPEKHGEQIKVNSIQLKAGKGIVGDRYYGHRISHKRKNLTLVEAENIEAFCQTYHQPIELYNTRRNIITRGIRLNDLVGKDFFVGQVLCKGIELCEPCAVLARQFPESGLPPSKIIRAFENKGGLRAEILTNGILHVGDRINTADNG